jgi:hypothetical protein
LFDPQKYFTHPRTMRNPYRLVAIALISWSVLGMLILAPGAYFVLGYSQLQTAIAVGACIGGVVGLVVGIIGVSPVVSGHKIAAFRSVLSGSMVGAVVGAGALLVIGEFPKRSQADLSLIFWGPASLAIGALVGLVLAVVVQRVRPKN